MTSSGYRSGLTRRSLLNGSVRVGASAVGLALLGQWSAGPALADDRPATRVKVLVDDLIDRGADLARGQARGVVVRRGARSVRGGSGGELVSAPVALPFDATHLGLHWLLSEGSPADLSVSVRTSRPGQTWSAWQPVEVEAVADRGRAVEVYAALAEGGRGRLAQYRVEFGPGEATLDQMVVTAINSVDGPRVALATSAPLTYPFTAADGTQLVVVTREGWGCDESLGLNSDGTKIWPEMYVPAKKLVLHHTATTNRYTDGAAQVRAVYTYHAQTQGWGDIGYNALVDRYGTVYEGRRGRDGSTGREVLSADVVAGHALSHNYGSVGVSAIGNFDQAKPTAAMLAAIDQVFVFESGRHFIVPTIATDFLRSDDTWHLGLNNISGHYESNSTKCPGRYLKSYLSTLRTHVSTRLNGGMAPSLVGTASREQTAPGSLSFTWSGSGPWQYCLEGWRRKPSSEDLIYLSGYTKLGADVLSTSQLWSSISGTQLSIGGLAAGHYTMHLRGGAGLYEGNQTHLIR